MLLSRLHEHKNANFVLEKPENGGSEGQKSTKTSILCSECPKTGVPDPKSAQIPRFCAREDVRGDREGRNWHSEDKNCHREDKDWHREA